MDGVGPLGGVAEYIEAYEQWIDGIGELPFLEDYGIGTVYSVKARAPYSLIGSLMLSSIFALNATGCPERPKKRVDPKPAPPVIERKTIPPKVVIKLPTKPKPAIIGVKRDGVKKVTITLNSVAFKGIVEGRIQARLQVAYCWYTGKIDPSNPNTVVFQPEWTPPTEGARIAVGLADIETRKYISSFLLSG